MACVVMLRAAPLPRGCSLLLGMDISKPVNSCVLLDAAGGKVVRAVPDLSQRLGEEMFVERELYLSAYDPQGWLEVLSRLTGKRAGGPGWANSAGEYATRFFKLGTWEWVQMLCRERERRKGETEMSRK